MNLVFMILLGLLMLCPSNVMAKDTLTLAIKGEPAEGYDPTLGWGRYGSPLFQSTLLKRNENMKIVTDLATSYSLSKDGLLWTVTIREDAKFSDGTPLTAKDVEYTFNTAAQAGGKVDLMSLNKAEAKDATTILFTLKKTDTATPSTLSS